MVTTRLVYMAHKWRLTFLEFSQVVAGRPHFHNWIHPALRSGLKRFARTTLWDGISGWGMADTVHGALNRKRRARRRYHSGHDVPDGTSRKTILPFTTSFLEPAVDVLLNGSSHASAPRGRPHSATSQPPPNAVLSATLRFVLGFGLLTATFAPLPVSAEGGDDGLLVDVETFETLKEGYCYEDHIPSYGAWEWVTKFKCGSKGGVLLAKAECQKSYKKGRRTFCAKFRTNDRFKEALAEFKRKEISRKARARKDDILRAKEILAALGYYQGGRPKSSAFDDGLSRAINDFLESTSTDLEDFGIHTDAIGRRYLSSALMEKLSEADQGYCFSPPYGKPQAIAAQREGWCLKGSQERFVRLSSAADCAADQGFHLPRDACRTDFGSTCKILRFDAAAAFLREAEGEKEIHFASNATQCIDQGGLLISEKDCAEKVETTTLLRHEYCRQIRAERLSAIKARWLAATAYCFLGKKPYSRKARSSCRDAGGIVMAPRHCGAFSGSGGEKSSVCMSLSPAGDVYVKTELASRDAHATSVAKAGKQPEEKNEGEADQALAAAESETSPKETPIATEQVIALQKALAFFGLYKGGIDGDAGPNTQRAVNQWLKKQGRFPEEVSRALIQEITAEAKAEKARIAKAEEAKRKAEKAKATELAKQKEREKRNQQFIALRSELLNHIVSARDLLGKHPRYPQKADLEKTIYETIATLALDDLEAMTAGRAALLPGIQNLTNYRDEQIGLADAKKKEEAERQLAEAMEAEAKRKADEARQKAEEERRQAEAARLAAEKERKEEEEKERQLAAAKEAEQKRKAEKEKRNQQLIAFRSELLKDVVSVRDLLDDYPDYPLKGGLETAINNAIAVLGLNDPEAIRTQKTILNAAAANFEHYRERQIALADAKKKEEAERQLAAAMEAETKRKAEEEKQKAEKARLAEEQSKNSSDNLAGLSLEPMDKVFQVPETTNIRAAPKVLSDRVGRINAGESLTILAKVSGEHWYLVETDQGERGFVFADAITLASGEKKVAAKAKNPAIPDIDFGKYHALVIGNNTYRELPDLQSAVNDARTVGALLEHQYGFEVELLTNATRSEIFGSLASMRRRVGSNDNVLIYYAGHGWLDEEADEGYWMPIDAEEDSPSNWLSSANLTSEIRRSKAKHILVVADSCFSGTLTRGLTIKSRTPDYLERIAAKKARTALTSGGLEPVMDSGGESNHSVFAAAFLSILNENDAVLDGHQLFTLVRKKVIMGSEQTPEYGDIRRAGHDGGDFLFVRQ